MSATKRNNYKGKITIRLFTTSDKQAIWQC